MNKKIGVVLFLAFLCCVPSPTFASVMNATKLMDVCSLPDKPLSDITDSTEKMQVALNGLQCQAYVEGVITGYELGMGGDKNSKHHILVCVPDGVTIGQTSRIVELYLKAHPEQLHLSPAVLTITSLKEAFPCE